MKSMLIIGLGKFGHHLCKDLLEHGNDVMIVDDNEKALEDLLPYVTSAKIGDCTNPDVLESLDIPSFDVCFVCIGDNFQSSLEITSLLKEFGAKLVVSKANRDIQAKFLARNGADEVIYPDFDMAERVAMRHSDNHVFDYIELSPGYSVYEIAVKPDWVGKTVRELNFRVAYEISIIGAKENGRMLTLPGADHVFTAEEHLLIIGRNEVVEKMLKTYK